MADRVANFGQRWKAEIIVAALFLVIACLAIIDSRWCNFFIAPDKPTLANIGALLFSGIALCLVLRRLTHQENKEVDDRFAAAMGLLGNADASVRAGAIYSLYHLAIKEKKYRVQIAQILCAHICSVTAGKEYREQNRLRPSKDVQTAINVLFKNVNDEKGIYFEAPDRDKLPEIELSHAYLVGADFFGAHCQSALFINAYCQGAHFYRALCNDASFYDAFCQGANFTNAELARNHIYWLNGQAGVGGFGAAHCEGASFKNVNCDGVSFSGAFCQGTLFSSDRCEDHIFNNTVIAGKLEFDEEGEKILLAMKKEGGALYARMREIIHDNEGRDLATGTPETARGANS